ncbi:hypothetical protein [Mesorhizobium sp. ES1-4]|uniref:hypothetical protein n=1 Tax=Mesorhizobium sp. ES1-4 TaxID=2876627 RepID=UPI001CCA0AAE|nr:hypothetical protein [Mesorhizobium sp. ES1-4]MBZ9798365.1 hypothetical protein [Mesorhizobium sp. ES1-4]
MKSNWLFFSGWVIVVAGALLLVRVISGGKGIHGRHCQLVPVQATDCTLFAGSIAISPLFFPFTLLPYLLFCLYKVKMLPAQNYTSEQNVFSTNVVFLSLLSSSLVAMLFATMLSESLGVPDRDQITRLIQDVSLFKENIAEYSEYGNKFYSTSSSENAIFALVISPYFSLVPLLLFNYYFIRFPGHLMSVKSRAYQLFDGGDKNLSIIRRAFYVLSLVSVGSVVFKFVTYFAPSVPPSRMTFFRYPIDGEFFYFLDASNGIISALQFALVNFAEVTLLLLYIAMSIIFRPASGVSRGD